MKSKVNKLLLWSLITSFCVFIPFQSEAKAVTVTKITDKNAYKAYLKEAEAAYELYKQGKQLQNQIEKMQQALEHHDYSNLAGTYSFLINTVDDMNEILKTADGMNTSITEMEDQWTEAHRDYDSKEATEAKKAEWAAERQKRMDASEARSTKIMNIFGDPDRTKAELAQIDKELKLNQYSDINKASPVKQMQLLGQIMSHMLKDSKMMQMYVANKARAETVEKQEAEKEKKQNEAIAKNNADKAEANTAVIAQEKASVTYDSGSVPSSVDEWLRSQQAYENEIKSKNSNSQLKKN